MGNSELERPIEPVRKLRERKPHQRHPYLVDAAIYKKTVRGVAGAYVAPSQLGRFGLGRSSSPDLPYSSESDDLNEPRAHSDHCNMRQDIAPESEAESTGSMENKYCPPRRLHDSSAISKLKFSYDQSADQGDERANRSRKLKHLKRIRQAELARTSVIDNETVNTSYCF